MWDGEGERERERLRSVKRGAVREKKDGRELMTTMQLRMSYMLLRHICIYTRCGVFGTLWCIPYSLHYSA